MITENESGALTPQILQKSEMIESLQKAEIDKQISTAKAFPRDVERSLKKMEQLAMLDDETAADCFYALQRGSTDKTLIEGISVRMAEIIASCWGNVRVQAIIVGHDGKKISAMASCIDLESNYGASVQVDRRITDRMGRTFSDDMIVVTGNAAAAIAYRNAVLKVIPKAITKNLLIRVKKVAKGKALDIETRRQKMLDAFAKLTVQPAEILEFAKVKSISEIGTDELMTLLGLYNAIKEGSTTVAESFRPEKKDATTGKETEKIEKIYDTQPQAETETNPEHDLTKQQPEQPKDEAPKATAKATKGKAVQQGTMFDQTQGEQPK